jgi:hypothetical protein
VNDKEVLDQAPARGIGVHQPDETFTKATEEFKNKDLALVEQEAIKAGIRNPGQKIAQLRSLMDKWEKLVVPIGYDEEKLLPLFTREIFAKIDAGKYAM